MRNQNLDDFILDGLRNLSGARTDAAFRSYLQSLQPAVIHLRQSYRSHRVKIDYSDAKTQAAYLIAYYPKYAEMTRHFLDRLSGTAPFADRKYLQVCLFAAGALPEVAGLLDFVSEKYPAIESITIYAYDIAAKTWKISHDIVQKYIVPKLWNKRFHFHSHAIDLCNRVEFSLTEEVLKSSHLFIFQNFLNELEDSEALRINIRFLLEKMPVSSRLIIADLAKHAAASEAQTKIETLVKTLNSESEKLDGKALFEFQSLRSQVLCARCTFPLPKLISDCVLTGENDRIPSRSSEFNFIEALKIHERKPVVAQQFGLPAKKPEIVSVRKAIVRSQSASKPTPPTPKKEAQPAFVTAEDFRNLLSRLEHLQDNLNQLQPTVDDLRSRLEQSIDQSNSKITAAQTQFRQLEALTQSLREKIDSQTNSTQEIRHLQSKIDTQSEEIAGSIDQANQQIDSLFERTEALFDRANQLEALANPQRQNEQIVQVETGLQRLIKAEQESAAKQLSRMRTALIFTSVMAGASLIVAIAALLR